MSPVQVILVTLLGVSCLFAVVTAARSNLDELRKLQRDVPAVTSVTFLVTVNDTWDPKLIADKSMKESDNNKFTLTTSGCIATVKTPALRPNHIHNTTTEQIHVGSCDHGTLDFVVITPSGDGVNAMTVLLEFHSSVIEDAMPPTCSISWNGTYLEPRVPYTQDQSLLPGCMAKVSREGYHLTYYWFSLLEWTF